MTALDALSPTAFDQALAELQTPALLTAALDDKLGHARRGLVALATGEIAVMERALEALAEDDVPPARGVRLMLRAQIGDYAGVLSTPPDPLGAALLELEDACYTSAAHAVAHTQTGDFDLAICQLSVAIAFGRAVGLRNRVDMLLLERERLMSLRGTPRPEQIQTMRLEAMPERRRAWACRTWAESLMALGDYRGALRVLGHPSGDRPATSALRAFLHGLLGLPITPAGEDEARLDYRVLARLVTEQPEPGDWQLAHGMSGQPQGAYARLLEGIVMTGTPSALESAGRIIGMTPPARPDQAGIHALLWLRVLSVGGFHPCPSDVMKAVSELPDRLRTTQPLLQLIERFMPQVAVLLACCDALAGLDAHMVDVPIICGKQLLWRGASHTLPGRTGKYTVLEGAGLPVDALAREEKRRLQARLQELGVHRAVNAGEVLRAAQTLESRFRMTGDVEWQEAWGGATRRIKALLCAETQDVLSTYT